MRAAPANLEHRPRIAAAARGLHQAGRSRYCLPGLWCLHFYDYSGELRVNGRAFAIEPGYASVLPPGARLEYVFRGPSVHLYAHFALPKAAGSPLQAPVMVNFGDGFALHFDEFERAIGWFAQQPTRTAITVWALLWECADLVPSACEQPAQPHPAVVTVIEAIERRLHEPLYGGDLARTVDLSHQHLIRLFQAATGSTLQRYIRERRLRRARHLLVHSTLPIKAIAAEVGIPDLHQFNKTVRQNLGRSPRGMREAPQIAKANPV